MNWIELRLRLRFRLGFRFGLGLGLGVLTSKNAGQGAANFFKSRSKSKSLWGGFCLCLCYVMLCWSNTDSATAHGEAWNSVGLLFGSILGWCIPGFVCVGPKSAPTDRPCARHVQLGAGVLKSLLWPKTKWNHCWYGILPRWWSSGHGFAHNFLKKIYLKKYFWK